jgi:hypothetical protein
MHAFQGTTISLIHARREVIYHRIDSRFAMSCSEYRHHLRWFLALCVQQHQHQHLHNCKIRDHDHHACCRARKWPSNGITINNLFDTHSSPGIKTVNMRSKSNPETCPWISVLKSAFKISRRCLVSCLIQPSPTIHLSA